MNLVDGGEMLPDDIHPKPLAHLVVGAHASWLTILHNMYLEEVEGVSLSAFVHRILVPILETIQQQPEDLHILVTFKSTAVADLGRLRFNESTLPELLVGLRLSVAVWTPYAQGWCATHSTLGPTTKHLQLENGRLTRIYPDIDQHQVLRLTTVMAMTQARVPDDSSPMGCPAHGYEHPLTDHATTTWWHRRLLQYTPELISEVWDGKILLYYKDMAITLLKSELHHLHRDLVTCVGASHATLLSDVNATISVRKRDRTGLSPNFLTAAYLKSRRDPPDLQGIAGKVAFKAHLDTAFAEHLHGPHADLVSDTISSFVRQPALPLVHS